MMIFVLHPSLRRSISYDVQSHVDSEATLKDPLSNPPRVAQVEVDQPREHSTIIPS